jgi:deoxyribonuclease IV
MGRLGAHLSAAGGVSRAVAAARDLSCACLQVFLRAPGRWRATALDPVEIARFRDACRAAGLEGRCFAHAPYLLNLASSGGKLRAQSIAVLVEELRRAGKLGLAGVVLHPGAAGSDPAVEAEARCREALVEALEASGPAAPVILEGTAGSGSHLGRTPADLARLVAPAARGKIGICLDTAHLWGAGYDLPRDGWDRALAEVQESWDLAVPHLLHINDTPVRLGSRRDRHAPPGEGELGEAFYRRLLADERVAGVPMVLEIPPGKGNALVHEALERLRDWAGGGDARRRKRRTKPRVHRGE